MVENLVKLDIEKMLYDLYSQFQKQKTKYAIIENDVKRLISVFAGIETYKENKMK